MHRGGGWFHYLRGNDDAPSNTLSWAIVRRVLTYARPYTRDMLLMLIGIIVMSGLGLLTPLIFRDLIDNVLTESGANYGDRSRLNLLAAGLVLIPIINGAIQLSQRWLSSRIGEGIIYDLRVALYSHLQKMSLHFFTHTRTGELMSRMNNDVVGAQGAVTGTIVSMITNIITVVATLAIMLALEWRLTILGVLVLPIFVLIARRLGSQLRDISRAQMDYNAEMNAMMNETLNISGTLLVKLFGRRENEVARFDDRAAVVRDYGVRRSLTAGRFFILLGLVSVMGTALVYWIGGQLVLNGDFTVGTIVAFGAYLTQLYTPLQALINAPVNFASSVVSFERVFEIIDLPLDIVEQPDAIHLETVQGELIFQDVTFNYTVDDTSLLQDVRRYGEMDNVKAVLSGETTDKDDENESTYSQARENALRDISFAIAPSQLVALVGPSGAGKTTLTYLIPRLYDPTSGTITLDGHDLRDLKLDALAEHIGMVTQETYLFHDTIRMNLLYARMDATQSEIEQACKAANIHNFIAGLPDSYATVVGERGYRLSGGEKQRLAIARVILKDPRLLILDEATSSLDSQSEALIQEALARVQQGRTSIVIAHRLSTILAADNILVMDRGEIVERGNHDSLLAKDGLYAQLYRTQFQPERA